MNRHAVLIAALLVLLPAALPAAAAGRAGRRAGTQLPQLPLPADEELRPPGRVLRAGYPSQPRACAARTATAAIPPGNAGMGRKTPPQASSARPEPADIPQFCGRCHGDPQYMRNFNPTLPVDQLTKYRTSRHGELLLGAGDPKPAQCVSCHGVHDIRQVSDPPPRSTLPTCPAPARTATRISSTWPAMASRPTSTSNTPPACTGCPA